MGPATGSGEVGEDAQAEHAVSRLDSVLQRANRVEGIELEPEANECLRVLGREPADERRRAHEPRGLHRLDQVVCDGRVDCRTPVTSSTTALARSLAIPC